MGSDTLEDPKEVPVEAQSTSTSSDTVTHAPIPTRPVALEEIPPSVLAMSNLRCPSPPPILTNSNRSAQKLAVPATITVADSPVPSVTVKDAGKERISSGAPKETSAGRETIVAGGAILNQHAIEDTISPLSLPTLSHLTGRNDSVTSMDYTLNPPTTSSHHKAPSVHAHFYVDETFKGIRSRSASNSGSEVGSTVPTSASAIALGLSNLHMPVAKSPDVTSTEKFGNIDSTISESSINSSVQSPKELSPTIPSSGFPLLGEQNANIDPRLPQDDGKIHVLLGVCGALSTVKVKLIINKLLEIYTPEKIAIQLILTNSSEHFVSAEILQHLELAKKVRIWRDSDEWNTWKTRLDPVLHIELRRWADILIVSPLTANTLSKIALGLCDNLLTNVIRAWNTGYPILLAPSMVSYAYSAITTKRQLRLILEEMPWIEVLKPVEKVVGSYGDIGMGGMMDYNEIVNKIVLKLGGYPEEEDDENEENENAEDDDFDDDDEDEAEELDDDGDEEEDEAVDDDVPPAQVTK